jgi:demethylmenaquinone methyltransferase/2-methoxy-6-polyprenyl-1,4-benzoquinol methylase
MTFRLPSVEEKAQYVLNQFDRIAAKYDLLNDVISFGMHRQWKTKALDALIGKEPLVREVREGTYLDVCCGTGDLALKLASRLQPTAQVIAIDFSENMLKIGSSRESCSANTNSKITARVNWMRADAQQLPFDDNTFDGAIVAFGLRNLADLQRGIDEMARVVKPGGKVVNLDLGHPTNPLFAPIYNFYFGRLVPILGGILAGDLRAYRYLPASLQAYPKPEGITAIFARANLKNIAYQPLALGSVALHVGTVA